MAGLSQQETYTAWRNGPTRTCCNSVRKNGKSYTWEERAPPVMIWAWGWGRLCEKGHRAFSSCRLHMSKPSALAAEEFGGMLSCIKGSIASSWRDMLST